MIKQDVFQVKNVFITFQNKNQQYPRTDEWEFLNCEGIISFAMIIPRGNEN